jgi:glycosyltransferase involved in cell wall biosynthesis
MRIVMFTRYTAMAANSRYRLLQYAPLLEAAGHQVELRPMLGDDYLRALYGGGHRSLVCTMRGYARRLRQLSSLSRCDAVICDQEFLPYFPAAVETWIARRCPRLFVDYDDAAYFKYQHLGRLRERIPALMAAAEAVVVGNRYLAEFASRHNSNVHIIPTTIDVARYTPNQNHDVGEGVRLVWIGTPFTARFVLPIAPALAALREKYPGLRLRLIGAGTTLQEALPFAEVVPWSEAGEARLLAECDIGLMPIADNRFTRGKCGLKIIQYMASGLPVVASPVGANCDILSEGADGYFARPPQQWFGSLERLIVSPSLRRQLGRHGRAKALHQYSLQAGFQAWMQLLASSEDRHQADSACCTTAAVGS